MAGSNTMTVSVKDSTGATSTVPVAYTLSATTPPPLSDGLAVSPTTATAGTTVTCTSTASGGSGGYQYQFSRSGPDTSGTFVVTQAYGTSNAWNWATSSAMAGSNTIKVTVKDSSGATTTNSAAYTLAAGTTSTGNTYYMSPTGSDSGSGTITSPWKTLTHGAAALKAGDILYVRGGTYDWGDNNGSSLSIANGTATAPITIKAYPGETPVFDGTSSIIEFTEIGNSSFIVLDGLTLQNYSGDAIEIWNSAHDITIQNCVVQNIGTDINQDQGLYVEANTANIIIRNNLIKNVASGAIQGWHGPNVNGLQIYNNVILNCSIGIVLGDEGQNVQIYNNTIDNCQLGIDLGQAGQNDPVGVVNLVMENNIISNSSVGGLRVGSFDSAQVRGDYNCYYGNAVDIIWAGTNYSLSGLKSAKPEASLNEQHSITANPSYVSASTGNYQLNSGSPAIGAGTPLTLFNTNITGAVRASWDIGAY